ncbi:sensor histidine kinase [Alicyclobacillus fastidiosus]|uniref:histidine kinase n=1 Tax=Alicyclobacillus fastidiosus TaxID=392011 RepID=A0ABV5AGJ8_9BACL|nr:HAMP domain-containing sensor histidine kinase [Alicyclobacillus fastidiosus]WEH09013.1 HAMP domain-containing sensor histidine kinase [Alicyclobacillus fastidiosus]
MKNIVSVVQDIVNVFRAESLLRNVEINYEHESEYIPVTCNEQRIKQVFINIMKNAFEAEAKECKVSVNLVPDASAVSVTLNDNGQGIDPTRVKSIGEPFYTTKEKGTGLGLMVSKKIIQDHAGMLVLSSEAGVGTTVTITLPIVTPKTPSE